MLKAETYNGIENILRESDFEDFNKIKELVHKYEIIKRQEMREIFLNLYKELRKSGAVITDVYNDEIGDINVSWKEN